HALLCVGRRPLLRVALAQVELPRRLFPPVEARLLNERQPVVHRHVAELPPHQPDLVIRPLAEAVLGRLLESHGDHPFRAAPWLVRRRGRLYRLPAQWQAVGAKRAAGAKGSTAEGFPYNAGPSSSLGGVASSRGMR